ncbi:MAG: ATP synthase F1 subunit delta [Oligoflexia bacterium]|nr:ATP synthase F1 subunit delta [Oligoflexia bacterium]
MSKTAGKVSRRYARALFELCAPAQVEKMRDSLNTFAKLWQKSTELREALINPALPLAQRAAALRDIGLRIADNNETFANFLQLLLDKGRLSGIVGIATSFSKMVDELKKLLALEITSAFPLPAMEQSAIQNKIQAEFGSLASIEWRTDRALLGGLLVKSGDRLLDGSVRGSLEKVRGLLLS